MRLFPVSVVLICLLAACSEGPSSAPTSTAPPAAAASQPTTAAAPTEPAASNPYRFLDRYELRGLAFAYYQIPAGLDDPGILRAATELHHQDPDAMLILVDDTSQVAEYIRWAKASSAGDASVALPEEWAEAHIVANLQKMLGGGWRLYRGNGYDEMGSVD